jgi:8-oxo-dGTP pyrophosphatase MutT (NUDIX family)
VRPALTRALAAFPQVAAADGKVVLQDGASLAGIARSLAAQGHYRWRNEAFDVRATPDGPALGQIDRGAIPSFGVVAAGVHVNGLVHRSDGLHVWIARRAADKLLDPGKLDHITAGGVPAGLTPAQTLLKEAAEEAAIPAVLASRARLVITIGYAMERPEGLRRDRLYCYDLDLPADFTPLAADGEVASFELWPIARVFQTVRDTDAFKFNVNLVLIDLFLREGLIPDGDAAALRAALDPGDA